MAIIEFRSSRKNAVPVNSAYVGHLDRLWYDPETNSIRVSDGVTPGGLPLSGNQQLVINSNGSQVSNTSSTLNFTGSGVSVTEDAGEIVIEIPGEDELTYAKRVDFVNDDIIYRGEATVGSLENSAVWRIRKITLSVDGDVKEEWADGSAAFAYVWDNRQSLSYS